MDALRVRGTTPGRTAVSSLMLILGSRLALFAMFQMLIAGGLAAAAGLAAGFEFVTAYAEHRKVRADCQGSAPEQRPRFAPMS